MNPAFLAALPSILDSMFNAIEYVSKRTNGTLDEKFIESRTLIRQALVAKAEGLTAPQDRNTFVATTGSGFVAAQTAELRVPVAGSGQTGSGFVGVSNPANLATHAPEGHEDLI